MNIFKPVKTTHAVKPVKRVWRVFKLGLVFSLVVLVCFGFDFIMVSNNLASYSVFYARNVTELEGDDLKDLEVELLLKNLDRMKLPDLDRMKLPDIKGYEYDFDGRNSIYFWDKLGRTGSIGQIYRPTTCITYRDVHGNFFIYDGNFKNLVDYSPKGTYKSMPVSEVDQVAVKREVYDLVAPVLDNLREPRVNLQWLFNWVYRDQIR